MPPHQVEFSTNSCFQPINNPSNVLHILQPSSQGFYPSCHISCVYHHCQPCSISICCCTLLILCYLCMYRQWYCLYSHLRTCCRTCHHYSFGTCCSNCTISLTSTFSPTHPLALFFIHNTLLFSLVLLQKTLSPW